VKKMSLLRRKHIRKAREILKATAWTPLGDNLRKNILATDSTAPYIPPHCNPFDYPTKPSKYDPYANDDNEAQRLINDLEQREKELKKKEKKLKKEQEDFKKEQEKLEAERKKIEEEKAVIEKERADLDERRNKIEDAEFKKSELNELGDFPT
jgi:septal ring factor EnvC (AmiA/AmiB activator)